MPAVSKTDQFTVESYKVSVIQKPGGPERTLTLVSPQVAGGKRTTATLLSQPVNPFAPTLGAVETSSVELVSWISPGLFDSMYAILLTEKPVFCRYNYTINTDQPKTTSWNLNTVDITTDTETPGDFEK
ncbi:hypothetical protein [Spirosoma montaniterrae]|uniref:Uncharacterized protein n=1 Tax=Spirosoma montaniterrae TaxID=1178516 RepID=A0A1P9WVA0_9BACT|nr:hypothetical protein [Spirosoma montaniterrae]AQG79289.1 hypothetical protein AWR27_08095 [Spirosoma montaniterrae]